MDIITNLFSPLNSREYCGIFYGFEVFYFVLFTFALFGAIISHKKMDLQHYLLLFIGLFFKFLMYAQSRLLYSMCAN